MSCWGSRVWPPVVPPTGFCPLADWVPYCLAFGGPLQPHCIYSYGCNSQAVSAAQLRAGGVQSSLTPILATDARGPPRGPLSLPGLPHPPLASTPHAAASWSWGHCLSPFLCLASPRLFLPSCTFPCCWGHREAASQLPLSQGKHNACPLGSGFPALSRSFSFLLQSFCPGLDGGGVWARAACGKGTGPTLETLALPCCPLGSIPGPGRSPGGGNGSPLQYSCLGNPMDRGAWWATVHGVAKSQTPLSD